MSEQKTYNGWTNYETWNIALWIGNEQGSSSYWAEHAQACYDEAEADDSFTKEERAALDLSEHLKTEFEESKDNLLDTANLSSSVWADLLGAALSEVNWYEIAEHYIEDVDKDESI